MKLQDKSKKFNSYLRKNGAECAVLLKMDGKFPLKATGPIAVYGSGARNTVKGGTGSGENTSDYFVTIEEGLRHTGFQITTDAWLDGYDTIRKQAKQKFLKDLKAEARAKHAMPVHIAMGRCMLEPEYQLPMNGSGNTAIYVLSRISGEGSDRAPVEGDILLTKTEIRDILFCNAHYDHFMLVLNVGGVVDLSPVRDVKNILLLSPLGAWTGAVLADILLGRSNPSGKLTTTWSAWEDYPKIGGFGDKNETRYKEGIYVGYRYFDSVGKKPLFPFGYGLSYTEFAISERAFSLHAQTVTVSATVKNTGAYPGKEVVELYLSAPQGRLDHPYQELVGFTKTKELSPGEEQRISISFEMSEMASYDSSVSGYILEAGGYILRLGTSSTNTAAIGIIHIAEEISCAQVKRIVPLPDFADFRPASREAEKIDGLKVLELAKDAVTVELPHYDRENNIDKSVEKLPDDQLIKLNIGAFDPKGGLKSMIGNASFTVAGAAGQTSMEAKIFGIPSMVMADGPGGLRISRDYVRDKQGIAHTLGAGLPESVMELMPKFIAFIMKQLSYKPKKSDVIQHQITTALPIGTAIAQSFNVEFAQACGDLVGGEMEQFGVHLWLAPALNIHRDIRCGRNFEYFSEDPVLSGELAAAIVSGVQKHPKCGATLKHFACNNQELNRTQNNSQLSERALREIYLKGFGIAIRKSQPKAVMTSYNLINGTHSGESRSLIEDYLRSEQGFQGVVMTDWVVDGFGESKDCIYPTSTAPRVLMAGGDLFMPGSKSDYESIVKGLRDGTVTRKQLQINATRTVRIARELIG